MNKMELLVNNNVTNRQLIRNRESLGFLKCVKTDDKPSSPHFPCKFALVEWQDHLQWPKPHERLPRVQSMACHVSLFYRKPSYHPNRQQRRGTENRVAFLKLLYSCWYVGVPAATNYVAHKLPRTSEAPPTKSPPPKCYKRVSHSVVRSSAKLSFPVGLSRFY